jgi:hypothetical protein
MVHSPPCLLWGWTVCGTIGATVGKPEEADMSKLLAVTLAIGLLLAPAACGGATPTAATLANPAAGPSPASTGTGQPDLTSRCSLLDSRDVASLFSSAEVEGPVHQVGVVSHPIFATESSGIYHVFHRPGSMDTELLQVIYGVDAAGRKEIACAIVAF